MILRPLPLGRWLLATLLLIATTVQAQTGYFTPLSSGQARVATTANSTTNGPISPRRATYYSLKTADLGSYLRKAPLEFRSSAAPLRLTIPLPNGTQETFGVYESPILAPAIAAQNPTIKTYTGRSLANPAYTIRLSMTSSGFDAVILGVENDAVYYSKVSPNAADQSYVTYFAQDVKKATEAQPFGMMGGRCGVESKPVDISQQPKSQARMATNAGNVLRTFRLAVAATGEFTQRKGSGNVQTAFNALVAYVNRMTAVYRVELNVAFQLVSGTNLVYPDPNTDPYDNSKQAQMLDENQANLVNVLGVNAFDIGHVFGASRGSGGGIASSPSICNDEQKGRGVSGVGDGSFAPVFDDQLITHEVGHQFSMQHTFNSVIPVCTTRKAEASVEPGAGATIMSYGFTCRTDNYEQPAYEPFLNFHAFSIDQANAQIAKVSCFSTTNLTNAAPVIGQFPANATIPKSTPFELNATATDANASDVLTYSWEGMNIGTEDPTAATLLDTSKPPFFRSYIPVSTGYRAFPRLASILDGTNTAKGDKLPSVAIETTNRLTVRDGVGGVTMRDVTVTIDGNSGPFLITSDLNGSYTGGTQQTVTWNVNNTDQAPVSAANVNILLSTDGGLTFPTTLLANTPNDGTEPVTFPNVTANKCRLKVIASNNIFFDISNSNFTVLDPNNQPPVAVAIPNQTGTLDAAFAFTPPAFTDPENQALDYRAVGLPAGLSMNVTTRAITGTPAAVGPFSVTVIATDPGNLSASTMFTLTVNTIPLVQLVASVSVVSPTVLTTGAIVANATASGGRPPYQFIFNGIGGSYSRRSTTPSSVTITKMSAGEKTLQLTVIDNTLPTNQTIVATVNVTVTDPNAPVVKVASNDPNAAEGSSAGSSKVQARIAYAAAADPELEDVGYIQFERSNTNGILVVNYQVLGTATNGVDYDALPTSVTFADGESVAIQEIDPIEDSEVEGEEYIEIVLLDSPDYDPDPNQSNTRVTLKDNDVAPTPSTPANLTVTSFTCNLSNTNALSRVDFVLGYKNGTFVPALPAVLIVGVTGNGSLGTRYSFPFDRNVNTLTVQDAATRSTYFTWDIRQACGTTQPPSPTVVVPPSPTVVVPPTPVSSLTINSFTCTINPSPMLSRVDFVVNYAVPTFAPVNPLLIVGVTGNGQVGTRYSFPFDRNVTSLAIQDAATRSTYFVWNIRAACGAGMARVAEPTATWQVSINGNPTHGPLEVVVKGAQGKSLELSVQDVSGRQLVVRRVQPQTNEHHETFDLSAQPTGLFILRASDKQHSQSVKVVKE